MSAQGPLIACHNIMHGLRLAPLMRVYEALSRTIGLSVLCLQETRAGHAETVRETLGERYRVVARPNEGLGLVYDGSEIAVREEAMVPLPKLVALPRFARLYMQSRDPEQKYAQICTVEPQRGEAFTLVNFHLDAAGGNIHRRGQLEYVTRELVNRGLARRLIACGDANIFALRKHADAYARTLAPLTALGAVDNETRPTHFFSRSRDPKLAQRVLVRLGKLGLDAPRRYDVMCSNIPATRGQIETPDSDHDLLWVRLQGAA